MDTDRIWLGIVLIIVFLLLKILFSACEVAFIEVNDAKIKKMAESDKRAKRLVDIISSPNKLLGTVAVINTLTDVAITLICTIYLFNIIRDGFLDIIANSVVCNILTILIILLIVTIIIVLFGETIPKKIAQKHCDAVALNLCSLFRFIMMLFMPIVLFVTGIISLFCKIFGLSVGNKKEAVTEEEIMMMVDAVNETGGIEESQKEMINNIFEFDDIIVSDVMTHRTDIVAIEKNSNVIDLVKLAIEEGFSRIPVYEGSIDSIVGVIFVKDLLPLIISQDAEKKQVKDFMREILYIPKTNHCRDLFKQFTSLKAQIAVVVDEYGGTAGIVSMEDILETIVGNIQDEYDNETEDIVKISENVYEVMGNADPEKVLEKFSIALPEEHDYDTISGFIIDLLGYIPLAGTHPKIDYKNLTFTVLDSEEKRLTKIRITVNYSLEELIE